MARKVDYEAKIEMVKSKIENHQEAIKKLKAQLNELEELKSENDYKDLLTYMKDNSLSAADVISSIQSQSNEG